MIDSIKSLIKRIDGRFVKTTIAIMIVSALISLAELLIIDPGFTNRFAAFALFALTTMLSLTLYIYVLKMHSKDKHITRTLGVVFTAVSITVLLSFVMREFVHGYAMPIALCGIIIVLISDKRIALFATVIATQIVFVTYSITAVYYDTTLGDAIAVVTAMASGLFIVYFIDQSYTRMRLIVIALITGIIMGMFAAVATTIADKSIAVVIQSALWTLAGNFIAVSVAMIILPVIEKASGLVSNFSLMEYCSFDNPVLKRLQDEAPGTFNHSLVVGNLAEHCALAIGKNPTLARASAYYHDIGKLKDPEYFVENQKDNYNPHDDLIPEISVRKITMHTDEGYKILRKHRFPKFIIDVAREHHGDSPLQFFYFKAQSITEGELGSDQYRYAGPKPSSVTSAIVMIADIVEATSRTKGAMTSAEIKSMVDKLIKDKINHNQFDDCDITMNDLKIIRNTIVNVLPGIYHGRLSYPEKKL